MQSNSVHVTRPVCLDVLLVAYRLVVRKHLGRVLVVLLLLEAVHLVAQNYIFAIKHHTVPIPSLKHPWLPDAWTRNVTESVAAVITVDVDGNFTDRVAHFNVRLHAIRKRLLLTEPGNFARTTCRTSGVGNYRVRVNATQRVVSGVNENYIDELADNPDIVTVVLPWLRSRSNWSSITDFSNLLYQRYFGWSADNVLCTWIETPEVIRQRYDSIYRRTCNRNINDTTRAQSLQPLYFNAKPITTKHYWPNNGSAYPEHFYTTTPPYVFHMHIHRDAVISKDGDVITARTKLVLYACTHDIKLELPLGGKLSHVPCYDEVYLIHQFWGTGIFHRMAEIVPRLALCLEFLRAHPEIRILAPEVRGRLGELLEIVGLDKSRLVRGIVHAKIVYQPRATACGFANVQESQMLSQLYRDYITRTFPPQPRNRLILIRRSGSRRFTQQARIEQALERAARDYNLTYTLFIDNPTPSLNDTMMLFHSAVMIVAPVGAGESNMFFSRPGTYVVEGVCNLHSVNLCFQRLAHILGHHWHGITSRRGCEAVVDVTAETVEHAVHSYLRLWSLEHSS